MPSSPTLLFESGIYIYCSHTTMGSGPLQYKSQPWGAEPLTLRHYASMCTSSYRKYRCGHKRLQGRTYCGSATTNPATRRKTRCQWNNTTIIRDNALCGNPQCYLNDLKANRWTCCQCGETGNMMDGCLGPPGGGTGKCPHEVCRNCSYSR